MSHLTSLTHNCDTAKHSDGRVSGSIVGLDRWNLALGLMVRTPQIADTRYAVTAILTGLLWTGSAGPTLAVFVSRFHILGL